MERFNRTLVNSMYVCDGHTVIGHRNSGIDGRFQPADQLFPGDHAAPALYHHGIVFHFTGNTVEPGNRGKCKLLSGEIAEPAWDLYPTDIIAGNMMGTGFK